MQKILIVLFAALVFLNAPHSFAQEGMSAPPPAAPAAPLPAWMTYKDPYSGRGSSDLSNPHRTVDELAIWAQQAAADVLSFRSEDYKIKLKDYKKYFLQEGWQHYAAYLTEAKLINMVSEPGYSVGAIIDSVPEIISYGPMDGAYHWILKMPVTLSFFNTDAAGNTKTGASTRYTLFLDIVRVAEGGSVDGIAINNWRMDEVQKKR